MLMKMPLPRRNERKHGKEEIQAGGCGGGTAQCGKIHAV